MEHAKAALTIAAENAAHNAPIHQAEGDHAQAGLDRQVAEDCRAAVDHLEDLEQ
ncbi:hypothetical protein [Pseudomonas knackmussii]|uniref:hypothetical protein n=1 Tax=Pseudomonas knackmussii TaxID=65741 RepID=UPI00191C4307|nr:hypothetical protein [Pseudomonas knackmussii]